jgi:hypothetical protein
MSLISGVEGNKLPKHLDLEAAVRQGEDQRGLQHRDELGQ